MGGRADCCGVVGTSFTARRWLSLNPCGSFGISCSFAVHIFAMIVVATHLIAGSFCAQAVFILLYLPLTFMALWSLFMAWTTDPGAVPMGARPLVTVSRAASGELSPSERARKRGLRRCQKCNDNYKPARAHHDSVTGRCIVKFDHYCPWVSNAVGAMNHKFFILFIFYTMNTCITSLLLIIVRGARCGFFKSASSASDDDNNNDPARDILIIDNDSSSSSNSTFFGTEEEEVMQEEEADGDLDETRDLFRDLQSIAPEPSFVNEECEDFHSTYMVIVLFCVAITFFIFTSCMLMEQVEAISTNQGKIARMKMRVGQGGTELQRVTEDFNEIFGGDSPKVAWHWFVPLPVQFPGSMHKVVMGFEWDPIFDPIPYREPSSTSIIDGSDNTLAGEPTTEVPIDLETGLAATDLDDVPIDTPADMPSPKTLKKRAVSNGSAALPELT